MRVIWKRAALKEIFRHLFTCMSFQNFLSVENLFIHSLSGNQCSSDTVPLKQVSL